MAIIDINQKPSENCNQEHTLLDLCVCVCLQHALMPRTDLLLLPPGRLTYLTYLPHRTF